MPEAPIFCPFCGLELNESGFCPDTNCPHNNSSLSKKRDLDEEMMKKQIYDEL